MAELFRFEDTCISGLKVIHRTLRQDHRGSFERVFCEQDLEQVLGERRILQINRSCNKETGITRGLHFQFPPFAEAKIVTCITGEIFDVAVDIRHSSKTFLHWFGITLSERCRRSIFIPEGFAHGFQVLEPNSQVLYLHTAPYSANHQGIIQILDPLVSIKWPIPVASQSERDKAQPVLDQSFDGIHL